MSTRRASRVESKLDFDDKGSWFEPDGSSLTKYLRSYYKDFSVVFLLQ